MRRSTAIALLALALPVAAVAQNALSRPKTAPAVDDSAKRAKLHVLFDEMHIDTNMQQIIDNLKNNVIPMTESSLGDHVPQSLQNQVMEMQKEMFDLIEQQLGWKTLEPMYVDIYAKNFTNQQIDDLIAFYKTPTGQAYISKVPEITNEAMQATMTKMNSLQPQMQKLMDDFKQQNAEALKEAQTNQKSGS
jgi:hypothetical protein